MYKHIMCGGPRGGRLRMLSLLNYNAPRDMRRNPPVLIEKYMQSSPIAAAGVLHYATYV
jgi:hypothetical protein